MRNESTTIQKCNSRLTALGLNSDAAFHRSRLILKIYRDVVWVLSERAEELQETAWIMGEQEMCIRDRASAMLSVPVPPLRKTPGLDGF